MQSGHENGQVVPVQMPTVHRVGTSSTAPPTAADAFTEMKRWIDGGHPSGSSRNILSRFHASEWVTNPSVYDKHSQREYARKIGRNPEVFCRQVNAFSKRFGVMNWRMKPRAGCDHVVTYSRKRRRVLPGVPRKRV